MLVLNLILAYWFDNFPLLVPYDGAGAGYHMIISSCGVVALGRVFILLAVARTTAAESKLHGQQ